jgi:hypothetical protein
LPDFQIVLGGLHYTDVFSTCDENQAKLIKCLYPDYANKISFYKKESDDLYHLHDLNMEANELR